jgi:phage terminase large subunit-like protein
VSDEDAFARWRSDPALFIEEVLVDPETGKPFILNDAERAFLAMAFEVDEAGRLKHPELVFAAPKKSGKTGFGALILLVVVLVLGGRFAEGVVVANDLEQAQGRVFTAARRIVEASPLLADSAVCTGSKIEFPELGATITAIASDYAGAAGANPNIAVFDELWAFTSERSRRLWDELVPPPTRKIACRLTVTYAGFEGESTLLEEIYNHGLKQPSVGDSLYAGDGLLMAWHHKPIAPWQTQAWLDQMRRQLRPNAFLRMIECRFVSSESTFVDMDWYDRCVNPEAAPVVADPNLPVWIGVDASVKHDSTAIAAVTFEVGGKVRLVAHRIFQPSPDKPLDFEATVERTVRDLYGRFDVRGVHYDPYQMQAVAQRLSASNVRMREFPQTVANLTAMGTNLYELIQGGGIEFYRNDDIRLAISRTIALETPRGMRLAKEKSSHKIDVVIALAMAVHAAMAAPRQQTIPVVAPIIYNGGPSYFRSYWTGAIPPAGLFDGRSGLKPGGDPLPSNEEQRRAATERLNRT